MKFYLKNCGMGQVSYDVLLNTANRVFTEREHELCAGEAEANFVITLKVDGEHKNDRYTICPADAGVALVAAADGHQIKGSVLVEHRQQPSHNAVGIAAAEVNVST